MRKNQKAGKINKPSFDQLVDIMAKLRSPQGCPWDREQTHQSIKGHLVEEAFEVVDALNRQDFNELKAELGDLLLQVVFHAQIAAEADSFTIEDVIGGIVDKLRRRHPHVFGEAELKTPKEVLSSWEKIKAVEKDGQSSLAGLPEILPALAYSQKLQEKAARVGFDWRVTEEILDKLAEEVAEMIACERRTQEIENEFGDILFTLVNLGRHLGIDAESALRRVARKFRDRFETMERMAQERGVDFAAADLAEKEELWREAKSKEAE